MRSPGRDYPPGIPPPGWGWRRWLVLFKPLVAVLAVCTMVLSAAGVIELAAAMDGRYVDAHISAIDAEADTCTLTWPGSPNASSTSTMPCPYGAELGAPVRAYANAVGEVFTTRTQALQVALLMMAFAVAMAGVVGFALATPDSDRWDASLWDMVFPAD